MSALLDRISSFDRFLGDSSSPDSAIWDRHTLRLDEAGAFPSDAVSALDEHGLQRLYVPRQFGGNLDDLLEPMLAIRHVARRDLTVAVAHGKTFLGSVCAWVDEGNLARHLAPIVLSGAPVSWGLTEAGRGSDLLRTTTRFDSKTDTLDGGKWPINNATRGQVMCVLARTSDSLNPRSLSLVLVDKSELVPASFQHGEKVMTHGVRGADISGITWSGAKLPPGRMLGEPGCGLEVVLRGLQVTRVTCTALSLGAADRALRQVIEFLSSREIYGTRLLSMRNALADAGSIISDALLAEATALVGARHISALPTELSLVSSLVKYVVPSIVDDLFRDSTQFLGARSQLAGFAGAGLFEKASRDNRVVGIFDGNSVVNLHAIINQFSLITRSGSAIEPFKLARILDPGEHPGRLTLNSLKLVSRTGSTLLAGVEELVASIAHSDPRLSRALDVYLRAFILLREEVRIAPRTNAPSFGHFDLARRLSYAFAGACALVLALGNSDSSDFGRDELWLTAVLYRVCVQLGYEIEGADSVYAEFAERICTRSGGSRIVSLLDRWAHD